MREEAELALTDRHDKTDISLDFTRWAMMNLLFYFTSSIDVSADLSPHERCMRYCLMAAIAESEGM